MILPGEVAPAQSSLLRAVSCSTAMGALNRVEGEKSFMAPGDFVFFF